MSKKDPKYLCTARYGRKIKLAYNTIMKRQKTVYECPRCGKVKVKRQAFGLWKCNSCETLYTGGAYQFATPEGNTIRRILKGEGNANV